MWNVACLRVPNPLSAGMLRVPASQARWLHRVVTWMGPAPYHVHGGHSRWGQRGPAPPCYSLKLCRGRGLGGASQGPCAGLGPGFGRWASPWEILALGRRSRAHLLVLVCNLFLLLRRGEPSESQGVKTFRTHISLLTPKAFSLRLPQNTRAHTGMIQIQKGQTLALPHSNGESGILRSCSYVPLVVVPSFRVLQK